ncbi:MAG TPA: glycosyltransferase [Candidatus Gallacutalibacter stercoravium]|nr:glycosyltransferase [Candidatus Gallacutalibacter stercoravium]
MQSQQPAVIFPDSAQVLYLVVPCYNEEAVLAETTRQLTDKLRGMIEQGLISPLSRILYVNDGSKDNTWGLIRQFYDANPLVLGLSLSRNRGHQNALLAGLMTAKEHADMVISLDADLQDDIGVIDQFVKKYYEGCDVVYGVRSSRKTDTFFKRFTAQSFYKLMSGLGVDVVYNHADYRLMSRRALNELQNFKEVNLFLRGIVPLIGFKSDVVEYERHNRFAGESKYPLKKMLSFAFDGITSFSVKPIRFITTLGIVIFTISIVMLLYFFIVYLCGKTVAGWTSIVVSVWAIGGLQLLAIGIIGEYIGKIYMESKARPKFIIDEFLDDAGKAQTGGDKSCK